MAHSHIEELSAAASDAADRPFLIMDDVAHSYRRVYDDVEALARGLADLGVTSGDRVLVMLPNVIEAVWTWWAVERLGAIDVPVSIEAVGASLRHIVSETRPRVVVATRELAERLLEADAGPSIELVVLVGEDVDVIDSVDTATTTIADVMALRDRKDLGSPPSASTTATVMFSSGTTGAPKGVMLSHGYYGHGMHAYDPVFKLEAGQRLYCTQPLCHIDPRMVVVQTLAARATVVLTRKFSASRYWAEVEHYDADGFVYIGAMLHLLFKQTAAITPGRRRIGIGSAIPPSIHHKFSERFNVDLIEGYGMTELYTALCQYPGEYGPGDVGRELPGITTRIVDAEDQPVEDGVPGQLLIRTDDPSAHMQGYWNRPEATVAAWQGLWFHTGDLVRRLPNGRIQYVGRVKDSIRRRGENVSAWEVESVANRLDEVLESAAVGFPAEIGDEDIALMVVPRPGRVIDPVSIRDAMAQDLPRYALPRFIDVVDNLPKTPSERIAKAVLRERGISARAHDFERRA